MSKLTGSQLILRERARQMIDEGWDEAHDDEHDECEMTEAAIRYAENARNIINAGVAMRSGSEGWAPRGWPWDAEWWKPSPDPIRNLVKAGALIAAEIDRLQRIPDALSLSRAKLVGDDAVGDDAVEL